MDTRPKAARKSGSGGMYNVINGALLRCCVQPTRAARILFKSESVCGDHISAFGSLAVLAAIRSTADHEDLASFTHLLGVIDQTHKAEVAAQQERISRLKNSLLVLGAQR